MYLLDTNAWIAYLSPGESPVAGKVRLYESEVCLCAVVKAELQYGAHKGTRTSGNLRLLSTLFSLFPSLPFDDRAAEHYGLLRARVEQLGTPVGPLDLMIASIAQAHGAIVVTSDVKEFLMVPGLSIEDWRIG